MHDVMLKMMIYIDDDILKDAGQLSIIDEGAKITM